jgi:acetyl-CoA C-acetyltransferase
MSECRFKDQIVPVEIPAKKKVLRRRCLQGQSPREDTTAKALRGGSRPSRDGTVTAGNAPGVNDGASACAMCGASQAKELGLKPMARIVAQASSGLAPEWVMMAPVETVRLLWKKTGWKNEDVDLYEINEAFSVAAIAVTRELGLDLNKVNVNGGAVALGHPIGASGARILTTLLYEMIRRDVHKGIAALCLGGGNAVGLAIER